MPPERRATGRVLNCYRRTMTPAAEQELSQRPVEERLCVALVKTAARLEAELNRLFRAHELTHATHSILRILSVRGHEGSSCGEIAEQLIAEVPDMTRLLDRLERLGYVRRERSKADRRMVRVTITEKGTATVELLREPVAEFYRAALAHMSEERQSLLLSLLDEARRPSEEGLRKPSQGTVELDAEL